MGVGGQIAPHSTGVPHPPFFCGPTQATPPGAPPARVGHSMSNADAPVITPIDSARSLWVGRSLAVSVTVSMLWLSLIYQWYQEGKQGIRHPLMRLDPLWRHAIQPACPG